MTYIDHFAEESVAYRNFRPNYPDNLYAYLANIAPSHSVAWDCGTGNGQAAEKLADYFEIVIATDINQPQLDAAIRRRNIQYHCSPAEKTEILANSLDLITVAQALHWFNFDLFYEEVNRVLKPGGIIAAWCYSLGKINAQIEPLLQKLYSEILGKNYWPKERNYIDEAYSTIPFPFKRIDVPSFSIIKKMNFSALIGYLETWSAVKEYQKCNHHNPIEFIYFDLQQAWGDPAKEYEMYWPLHLLVGKLI